MILAFTIGLLATVFIGFVIHGYVVIRKPPSTAGGIFLFFDVAAASICLFALLVIGLVVWLARQGYFELHR